MTGANFSKKRIATLAERGVQHMHPPCHNNMAKYHRLRLIFRFADQTNAPGQSQMFVSLEDYALLAGWGECPTE